MLPSYIYPGGKSADPRTEKQDRMDVLVTERLVENLGKLNCLWGQHRKGSPALEQWQGFKQFLHNSLQDRVDYDPVQGK